MSKAPISVQKSSPIHESKSKSNYELQYTRWLLKVLGVWPMITNNVSPASKLSSFLLIGFSFIAILFVSIPLIMFVILRMKAMKKRLIFIGPLSFRLQNLLKHIFMMYRSNIIKECINHIKDDWAEITIEDQNVMLECARLGRNLTSVCAIFMFSSGTFFHVFMPLMRPRKLNEFNVTIRPHLYPGYDFFVNSQATPTYEIIFAAHCLCAASAYTTVTAACNLAAVFVSHVCGQVQIVRLKLEKLENHTNRRNFKYVSEQIASVVKCHLKILRFSENIKRILREICLVEVVLSTFNICCLEFICLTVKCK